METSIIIMLVLLIMLIGSIATLKQDLKTCEKKVDKFRQQIEFEIEVRTEMQRLMSHVDFEQLHKKAIEHLKTHNHDKI